MPSLFAIVTAVAALLAFIAYRFSSGRAGHITLASAFLWLLSISLFWLNATTFPNDETRREVGDWLAAVPLLLALPLTVLALVALVADLEFKKEA